MEKEQVRKEISRMYIQRLIDEEALPTYIKITKNHFLIIRYESRNTARMKIHQFKPSCLAQDIIDVCEVEI